MDETQNANLKHFKEIYIDTAPKLIYYAYRYVDSSTAEDIVQDVFLKIWHKNSYLFMQSDIKAYLFRSVQNACLDYLKHQDVKGDYLKSTMIKLKIEEIYYNDDPHFLTSEDDRIAMIYKELNKLPPKCREIFIMHYVDEQKTSEIAKLLNISSRTVESQIYKALKFLRKILTILF